MTAGFRDLGSAIRNGERIRGEIPLLIQPEQTCYDMVTLLDEVYRLRKIAALFVSRAYEQHIQQEQK